MDSGQDRDGYGEANSLWCLACEPDARQDSFKCGERVSAGTQTAFFNRLPQIY